MAVDEFAMRNSVTTGIPSRKRRPLTEKQRDSIPRLFTSTVLRGHPQATVTILLTLYTVLTKTHVKADHVDDVGVNVTREDQPACALH